MSGGGDAVSKSAVIDVGVRQRILWIGGEAYPLHNIARAQTVRLVPRRASAVGAFVMAVLLWVVLGVGGAVALRFAEVSRSDLDTLTGYIVIGVLVLIVFSTIRLVVALARRTLYALVIETAGAPRTAVISPNEALLDQLVHQIMEAINNPRAEFRQQVENYYGGNHVKQYGANSLGMVNR
jgi:hypothetical protein